MTKTIVLKYDSKSPPYVAKLVGLSERYTFQRKFINYNHEKYEIKKKYTRSSGGRREGYGHFIRIPISSSGIYELSFTTGAKRYITISKDYKKHKITKKGAIKRLSKK